MDVPGVVPDSINCHGCNTPLDLTGQQAFTEVQCAQCGALSVVPAQFGNLLLLNALGVGGMGTVYKAIDTQLNRYVAVKILRNKFASDPHFIEIFAREARAAAAVNHPHVAQVYAFAEHEGEYYLTMELLERGSLDERITKKHKLPEGEVLKIGIAIAGGLRAAHQSNLLHRDIKPGNILFNEEGQPKLVDFGLALAQHETANDGSGVIWGTPYYIAPEKLRGQPEDFRSDMYSLGATLFHALAGRPPFDAKTASEVVTKHTNTPALNLKTFNPTLQDYTAHVIGRTLAKGPADRYQSYDALIHELETAERRLRERKDEPVVVTETGEQVTVKSALLTWGIVLACLVALVVLWFNRDKLGFGPPAPAPKPPPPVAQTTNLPAPPAAVVDEVDFTEDAPWTKTWSNLVVALAQQQYQAALNECENLKQLTRQRPHHRQWAFFMQGVTLVAAGRTAEAAPSFNQVGGLPQLPATVTPTSLVGPLAQFMQGALPARELQAGLPKFPAWAAAFTQWLIGLKEYDAGQFDAARATWSELQKLPGDPAQPWVLTLRGLAGKLTQEVEGIPATLAELERLRGAGQFDAALKLLRDTRAKTRLAAFKAQLDEREPVILAAQTAAAEKIAAAKQAELAQQQAAEEQARQQAAAEVARVNAVEPTLAPALALYDFKGAAAKYEALGGTLETAAGRQALEHRRAAVRWLQEFKTQLTADFRARPYDATKLVTRPGVKVTGQLVRATETQLIFQLPYGEMQAEWRDLPPATLYKLGEAYAQAFTATERPPLLARRYGALAVFARFYNLNPAAAAAQAVKADPAIQADLDAALGQ
ncbi:MAG: Serine/threonine-protein kinase PknD [Verrucomicrobiae bacterium]|nr:Serine/threonine-protein kinase PknD [Verrucomicrobiae bacterium]